MNIIATIPYYSVEVRFHENMIQCYDELSKKVLASTPYTNDIKNLRIENNQLYLVLIKKKKIISEISILLELISKKSELRTEAGYILDLHMFSPSHGFYFGYYEIGEFKLTEEMRLKKLRSYPVQNCTKGRVTKSKYIYIGCRENDDYFLVKLNWKSNKNPEILMKKSIPSAVMVMETIEDHLFIGLKNGNLQLWDLKKDEMIKKISLFSSTFSVLTAKGENITVASRSGDIARISKNGIIQWRTNITQEKIVGIYEDKNYILVINVRGDRFHININSDKPVTRRYIPLNLKGNAGLSSSIVKYRGRFVITGYGGIWAFSQQNSYLYMNSIHKQMGDPLMRIIKQHPFGFYSGDDEGSVCFWTLGKPKIEVENYDPPLKNYKAYLKFKEQSDHKLSNVSKSFKRRKKLQEELKNLLDKRR